MTDETQVEAAADGCAHIYGQISGRWSCVKCGTGEHPEAAAVAWIITEALAACPQATPFVRSRKAAQDILASDWLASHVAAAVQAERERIAAAIEEYAASEEQRLGVDQVGLVGNWIGGIREGALIARGTHVRPVSPIAVASEGETEGPFVIPAAAKLQPGDCVRYLGHGSWELVDEATPSPLRTTEEER